MKSISYYIFFAVLLLFVTGKVEAQTYQMTLTNVTKTSTTFEFDIYINSTGSDFTLTSYQGSINFNNQLAGTGTLSFSYLSNTSELANYPRYGIGINKADAKMELTFGSAATPSVTITSAKKRVGRFRLTNTTAFTNYTPDFSWCFTGNCYTVVTTTGYKNITNQSSHIVQMSPLKLILSAEKAILGNGAALRSKSGSIGTSVAYCPKNSSYIKFTVNLPKAANWYAWGRLFYETSSNSANAFNVKIDGGSAIPFGNNIDQFNKWHWDGDGTITSGTLANLPLGYLSAGTHTIVVSGREVGSTVMIDQLLLTPESTYKPTDTNINFLKENQQNSVEENVTAQAPQGFELMQNYPNPFNPSTTIRFSLENTSEVSLTVYDILGNEVQTLVNDVRDAGLHEVTFNAENLSSGVYLYVLKAGNYTATKKLMLMK